MPRKDQIQLFGTIDDHSNVTRLIKILGLVLLLAHPGVLLAEEEPDPFPNGIPEEIETRFVKVGELLELNKRCGTDTTKFAGKFEEEIDAKWSGNKALALKAYFDGVRGYYGDKYRNTLCPEKYKAVFGDALTRELE